MMLLSSLRPNEKQINSAQSNNTLPTPKHTRFLPLLIQLGDILKLKTKMMKISKQASVGLIHANASSNKTTNDRYCSVPSVYSGIDAPFI